MRSRVMLWAALLAGGLLGGATAATTAFTVQAVGRVLSESGNDQWLLMAWGLPPALGILLSHLWSRRVSKATTRYTAA